MLNGRPVAGMSAANLWIVKVEPLSPEADRAVIAQGGVGETLPSRFTAITITRAGATVERGAIALSMGQPTR